jgi:hypothetical protein
MDKHLTVLGALFTGAGIMGAIGMIIILSIFSVGTLIMGSVASEHSDLPALLVFLPAGFGILLALAIGISAIPSIIVGIGLLAKRRWVYVPALIVGIIDLAAFPFGTIAGIYAIWVFFQKETRQLLAT